MAVFIGAFVSNILTSVRYRICSASPLPRIVNDSDLLPQRMRPKAKTKARAEELKKEASLTRVVNDAMNRAEKMATKTIEDFESSVAMADPPPTQPRAPAPCPAISSQPISREAAR